MEIKFNVGQKVYTIGKIMVNEKPLWLYGEEEIESIVINKRATYIYVINGYCVEEKICFATKEQAQEECDKRNAQK